MADMVLERTTDTQEELDESLLALQGLNNMKLVFYCTLVRTLLCVLTLSYSPSDLRPSLKSSVCPGVSS